MTKRPHTVETSPIWFWILPGVLAVVGFGAGLGVRPAFTWMTNSIDMAPGPLRIAAEVPTPWAVSALTIVGVVGGLWLAEEMRTTSPMLAIDETGVRITSPTRAEFVAREPIAAATIDGDDLVLLDAKTGELSRTNVDDLSAGAIEAAFRARGYPWQHAPTLQFQRWIDGDPGLPEPLNGLLKKRSRALADDMSGTVADLTDQLREHGVAVRDRGGIQSYRLTNAGRSSVRCDAAPSPYTGQHDERGRGASAAPAAVPGGGRVHAGDRSATTHGGGAGGTHPDRTGRRPAQRGCAEGW